jgi:DNA polymerase III subunit epsilon
VGLARRARIRHHARTMENLNLERPLVCFDLETTGTDVRDDRIVQLALVRVEVDGSRQEFASLVNPGRPIPPGATAVHGISDDDVRAAPRFAELRPRLDEMLAGADLLGFNMIRFDLPLLQREIESSGGELDVKGRRLLDAMSIFHLKEPRHLAAALRFYCGRELEGAHDALADTLATLDVFDAQLAHYEDLPRDAAALHLLCNQRDDAYLDATRKLRWNDAGEATLSFGKHKGKSLRELGKSSRDYLEWMLRNDDFSAEVKDILREALGGVFPRRAGQEAATARPATPAGEGPWTLFPGGGA